MIPHVAAGISAPRSDLFGEDSTLSDAAMSQFHHGRSGALLSINATDIPQFFSLFFIDYCAIRKSVMLKRPFFFACTLRKLRPKFATERQRQ
ncbi:MAG: hypothetical protein E7H57_01820 [Pantoea sp.]|nr:hypothetical protein [Pantoea sp.]